MFFPALQQVMPLLLLPEIRIRRNNPLTHWVEAYSLL